MAFISDDNGDIELVQGDSGQLTISGLDTDKNYTIYFAIQDENRNAIGSEIAVNTSSLDTVTLEISASLTDLLTVDEDEDTATYYYGLKICDEDTGLEDTLLIGESEIGDLNQITVYPKKVEGT